MQLKEISLIGHHLFLTIYLKRFSQDLCGRLSKLNGHVVFGETVDLGPYLDPRCLGGDEYKFRLIGVVEHLGTMRGGHYVAYVRAAKGNKMADKEKADFVWYHASDAHMREASLEEVLRCDAYVHLVLRKTLTNSFYLPFIMTSKFNSGIEFTPCRRERVQRLRKN